MRRVVTKHVIDLLLWLAATPLAFLLRLEYGVATHVDEILLTVLLGLPVKALILAGLGFSRSRWSSIGTRDLATVALGVLVVTGVYGAAAFFLPVTYDIPRSIPLLEAMLALLLLGGVRILRRLLHERQTFHRVGGRKEAQRVLIVGAGEAGTMIAREMGRHPEQGRLPVGFLDDDPIKQRERMRGLKVLGAIRDLPEVVRQEKVDEVLIAVPSASGEVVRRIVELAQQAEVSYRIIPGMYELLSGQVSISQIREVDVNDLLRRDPIELEMNRIAEILRDRVVLVTGSGGSIGSEIVRQVARFAPRRVLLLGRGEGSLYQIQMEMAETHPHLAITTLLANIRDRDTLGRIFEEHQPEVIFHAAAHKHVPMLEANPDQAVYNNVQGTRNLAELALEHGVQHFVNISTDKAVNPTSVMGASKRVAEHVVHWVSQRAKPNQAFVSVRFGNVLGSRGSVVPLFKKQIARGGPITVTHPDMRRYFMTIPEASQLVLEAAAIADNGAVCVLDMGEPVRILDLARDLITLSGMEPGKDIEIHISGIRPGEKLFEELLTAEEGADKSTHEKVFIARRSGLEHEDFEAKLDNLYAAARTRDLGKVQEALCALVPSCQFLTAGKREEQDTPHASGDGQHAAATLSS